MKGYSIGVGLTSACPFSCSHCYSGAGRDPVHLDFSRLIHFVDEFPVSAINLGTGEACMHPDFIRVVTAILDRGIPLALTTAGPSLHSLPRELLSRFHDVDVSLDYPTAELHDRVRAPGAFRMVLEGLDRCGELGVTASLAMCLMKGNAEHMKGMCGFARDNRIPLRVNVYKPVFDQRLKPSYGEFWGAVSALFAETQVVSCSEPVVNAAIAYHGHVGEGAGSPCGINGFRVSPTGEVLPCVYWGPTGITIEQIVKRPELLAVCGQKCHGVPAPGACDGCPWRKTCLGGCAGRRYYTGLSEPDDYCFHLRGIIPPVLTPPENSGDRFIHSEYLCTMIGQPRE